MLDTDPDESRLNRSLSLLGRLLFGGLLTYMGVTNFENLDERITYADAKDVPKAEALVPIASGMLSLGGLGFVLGRRPRLSAGAVAAFFAGVTPTMHDFWNADGDERSSERNSFLKNAALFGAAIAFLVRGIDE